MLDGRDGGSSMGGSSDNGGFNAKSADVDDIDDEIPF
jgi:hypothetical protein